MSRPVFYNLGNPWVVATFSTKAHGNMKISSGKGEYNQQEFAGYLRETIPDAKLYVAKVVHGSEVRILNGNTSENFGNGIDAIINPQKGAVVGVTDADCPPVLLVGETPGENPVVAAIHAGWRSTVDKILIKSVEKMVNVTGVRRRSIRALIGPAICGRCYEFGSEAPERFKEYPPYYVKFRNNGSGKYLVNLPGIIWEQLRTAGVKNIQRVQVCTYENPDFFSDRRDKLRPVQAGIAVIGLKKSI